MSPTRIRILTCRHPYKNVCTINYSKSLQSKGLLRRSFVPALFGPCLIEAHIYFFPPTRIGPESFIKLPFNFFTGGYESASYFHLVVSLDNLWWNIFSLTSRFRFIFHQCSRKEIGFVGINLIRQNPRTSQILLLYSQTNNLINTLIQKTQTLHFLSLLV